jgi:hypothetical protein
VSFVSVLPAGMSLSDEERKMCERFEDYVEKIRKRKLRFTEEADLDKVYDSEAKENIPLPTYFSRCMSRYDRQRIEEEEHRILLESETESSQGTPHDESSSLNLMARLTLLDNAEKLRFLIARNALSIVDEALASPTPRIVEGEAYFAELEECQKVKKNLGDEKDRANVELQELSAEVVSLRALYEECQRKLHIKPV